MTTSSPSSQALDDVVDVARLGLEPTNLVSAAVARRNAEARRAILLLDPPLMLAQSLLGEHDRQIVQDHVVFGQRHVVRQPRPGKLDALEICQHIVLVDDAVAHPWLVERIVEERELARHHVDLAVRRNVARQLAGEILVTDGRERARVDPHRLAADVPERHQRAVVKHEIGVGGVLVDEVAALEIGGQQHAAGVALARDFGLCSRRCGCIGCDIRLCRSRNRRCGSCRRRRTNDAGCSACAPDWARCGSRRPIDRAGSRRSPCSRPSVVSWVTGV